MQFKMAGSPRFVQGFYRLYFAFWIPTLAWAATWWPPALMYWMARWLVIVPFAIVRPKYMRAVRGNLGRILRQAEDSSEVRRTAWRMMFEHAYHWIDFFRWSQLPVEKLTEALVIDEEHERFDAARRSGRGTLLLTAHMGNPEVGAVAMGKRLEPVKVLYWRDRFEKAEEFRQRMRRLGNVEGIPVDASPLSVVPALRTLSGGGVLASHGDRDPTGHSRTLEFFGAAAEFPVGPFLLAARSGALILPTFILLEDDRKLRISFEEPIEIGGDGDEEARIAVAMERWVRILERRIRAHPEQWYCFYPFWG